MQAPRHPRSGSLARARRAREGSARTVGLALASGVALLFVGVLVLSALRSTPRAASQPREAGEAPPDIKSVLTGGSAATGLAGGERPFLQVVDRDEPTRIKAEITADRSEPLEGKRYRLERPRAWIVLSRQQVAHVQADSARALLPGEGGDSRPEEALLEGNVVVRLFAADRSGRWPDLAAAVPTITLTTSSLRFDGTLGRLEFPREIRVDATQARFAGRGVTILFNEGAERLERVSIEQTEWIVITGSPEQGSVASRTPQATSPSPSPPAPTPTIANLTTAPSTAASAAERPVETMYKVVAENDVRVMQGGRTISAARADAWLRLIDGRLSPGAIALASPPAARTRVVNRRDADLTSAEPRSFITTLASLALAIASPDADSSQPPATATGTTPTHPTHPTPPTPPTPLPPVGPSDTVLTWSGPLEAVPLALAPRELSSNDVYVRFVASPVARVVFADQGAGLEGDADSVEYGATRRQIAIAGPSDAPGRTRVASAGTLTAQRFELDMTAGHARVPGQGTLVAAGKADDDATSLDQAHLTRTGATIFWDQEAAMDFLIADGRDLQPVAAWASGKVVATDGKKGLIRASRMSTKFAEPPPPQAAQQSPRVTLVSALGSVEATDGAGGSLRGDHLDLTLDRVADADVPVLLSVRGAAAAERDGESIQASELTIDLAQDADGNTQVAGITAKTGVQVVAKDGASASGDELTAVTTDQRVEIRGAPAQVGRDATQISGPFIRLEGVARRITVLGGGLFTHEADAASTEGTNSGRAGRASATWTRSMAYDDIAGIAVFRGGVEANWSGPLARDRASGDEIVLTLEPAPPERDPSPSTRPDGSNRRVLTATVTASTTGAVATPALLESRRYAPRSPDTLERLLYLEGASIIANNTTGLLDVPSRGKLLVTDRRDDTGSSPRAQSQPATVFASTSTGDTLFTWDGSLALDRGAGVLTMDSGVRMSREDAAGGMTELECRRLVAEFLDQTQADPSQAQTPGALARPFSPALRSVVASGSAWMRSGGREIAAQSLSYNASTQVVVAQAPPQSTVILLDPAQSAGPVRAQGLTWDLRNNRVDATGLQTIVAPR